MTTTTELPQQVILLDMDGTLEDPWACCKRKDRMGGTDQCRHLRTDTIEKVRNIQAVFPEARLVVLSWRAGLEQTTRTWLAQVGIEVDAVFVPRSADSERIGARDAGQIGFKVNVVRALRAQGVEIVAGFDDNRQVVEALRAEGVAEVLAPRLVQVRPHEWAAGYIGAPITREAPARALRDHDDWYNADRAAVA